MGQPCLWERELGRRKVLRDGNRHARAATSSDGLSWFRVIHDDEINQLQLIGPDLEGPRRVCMEVSKNSACRFDCGNWLGLRWSRIGERHTCENPRWMWWVRVLRKIVLAGITIIHI